MFGTFPRRCLDFFLAIHRDKFTERVNALAVGSTGSYAVGTGNVCGGKSRGSALRNRLVMDIQWR
jgi:hypothetical protein